MMPNTRSDLLTRLRRPTTLAVLVAAGLTVFLAVAVLTAWAIPSGDDDAPPTAMSAAPGLLAQNVVDNALPTPTPRVIEPVAAAGEASPPSEAASPAPILVTGRTDDPPVPIKPPAPIATLAPVATSTPVAVPTATPSPVPTTASTPTPDIFFEAVSAEDLSQLARGSWSMDENQLVNSIGANEAEPWIDLPRGSPSGDYAIEAEIRVKELAAGVCNQSFGVVAGGGTDGIVWGGGMFYGCQVNPTARLTDIKDWRDGYDRDRELAEAPFTLDRGWHIFRLEVRGVDLRLLIDGEEILETRGKLASPQAADDDQAGVWSQGVELGIRRIAIVEL